MIVIIIVITCCICFVFYRVTQPSRAYQNFLDKYHEEWIDAVYPPRPSRAKQSSWQQWREQRKARRDAV